LWRRRLGLERLTRHRSGRAIARRRTARLAAGRRVVSARVGGMSSCLEKGLIPAVELLQSHSPFLIETVLPYLFRLLVVA
jgi:hypothetical protein